MACANEIHENDVGTEFIVTIVECDASGNLVPVDISSATTKEILFQKPDGTTDTHVAEFTGVSSGGTGDGTDGKISYFTVTGDLTPVGIYRIQGRVVTPAGTWHSTIDSFMVKENL